MPRKLSDAAPSYPVRKVEDAGYFMIIKQPRYDEKGKFGNEQWAVSCQDMHTSEKFVLLFTGNKVRDNQMSDLCEALRDSAEPIGPCKVEAIPSKTAGMSDTWNIVDADPLEVATARNNKATISN